VDVSAPTVSVIVPTLNRPRLLRACLDALAAQDYPPDRFEVIVVNDGGVHPFDPEPAGERQGNVRLLTQPHTGPAGARNLGASRATGELLAFTDDDCRPARDWLRTLVLARPAAPCLLGGHTEPDGSRNIFGLTSQLIVDVVYRHYNKELGHARLVTTNNLLVPASDFAEVGGFDPTMAASEDREFCDRWRWHGKQTLYVPQAVVRHTNRQTFQGFWLQHLAYGRGAYHVQAACRRRGESEHPEFAFHLDVGNWIGYPISQARGWERPKVAGLLVVWQLANLTGFAYEAMLGLGRRVGSEDR
jgi:GT2 family glycosyltransferase